MKTWIRLTFAVLLGLSFMSQAADSPNLIVNGDAEAHICTNDWAAQTPVPGWKVLNGAASVLCYTAFNSTKETPLLPPNGLPGNALFTATGADTAIEQTVDLSAAASAIDSGQVNFTLSGWLGGWGKQPTGASLTAIFLDAKGLATSDPIMFSNTDGNARSNATGFVIRQSTGIVPAQTRKAVITVHFVSALTSYNESFADNLSLVLSGPVEALRPGVLQEVGDNTPKLAHVYVVMMENSHYADIINTGSDGKVVINPQMPFLASLAPKAVILSNMWGNYHPNDQNYLAIVAGDTFKYGQTYYPLNLAATHLGDLLDKQGRGWFSYAQNMGKPCNREPSPKGGFYSPENDPFSQFLTVTSNPAQCKAKRRDLKDFSTAITNKNLPDFAWIAADGFSNGEGAWLKNLSVTESLKVQDNFLQSTFKPLFESAQWKESPSLLIITWDEGQATGWPDNHLPTLLIGSPGLLKEGTVSTTHYDGYSILRTLERTFNLSGLGRFDKYAKPFDEEFQNGSILPLNADLNPPLSVTTRGSLQDSIGVVTVPAAVIQGTPLELSLTATPPKDTVAILIPFGQVPDEQSLKVQFAAGAATLTIPTKDLAPGVYGAWLVRGKSFPTRAPVVITIAPQPTLTPNNADVEVLGFTRDKKNPITLRQGANLVVYYCLPEAADKKTSWIGIFPAGTLPAKMTKKNPQLLHWIKTPGYDAKNQCGEAAVFTAGLKPNKGYQLYLFTAPAKLVGKGLAIDILPALP